MKKLLLLLLISFAAMSFAQNFNGRISSSIYTFERFDTLNSSEMYLRAYETLNLNFNYEKFSVRSFLNYETDVMTKLDSDPRLRFYNLYFEARDILNIATLKLGRQPIINSVAGGVYDGASLTLKKEAYKLNAYFGGSAPAYQKLELIENFSDNIIYGGKFSTTVLTDFQFGIAYVNKNFQPIKYKAIRSDTLLLPITVQIENKSNQYEFVSGEINYLKKGVVSVSTRYDYDLNFDQTSRFELDLRTDALDDVNLNFYYNFREPKIKYNSIFAVFDYGNTQEFELGADYKINQFVTLLGKVANVQYRSENSQRLALGLSTSYGSVNYRKTFGFAGELDAFSIFSGYTFWEGLFTPSLGLSYTSYKLSPDSDKNNLTSFLLGANLRPYRFLSFDLQGQYMDNKIYKNDLRLFFKINYWFNLNL